MIIAYVGTPGSGKSYEAVKKMLENLKLGRTVFTNIDGLDGDKQREHIKLKSGLNDIQLDEQLNHLDNEQIKEFWVYADKKPGSLVIVDEVHKLFSNRDWASSSNKDFTEWASTHRHGGFDVLLITQDIDKVDKHARSLIEWCYFFRKINHFGKLVSLKYRRYAYDDDNHHGKPVTEETLTYDKTVFPCYSSYDASGTEELGIQKNVNVLKHPVFLAIPVVLGIFIYFLSQSSLVSGNIFGTDDLAHLGDTLHESKENDISNLSDIVPDMTLDSFASGGDLSEELENMLPAEFASQMRKPSPYPRIKHDLILYRYSNGKMFATNLKETPELPDGVRIISMEYM